jgi:adenylyltransferase/sulfurtransferase
VIGTLGIVEHDTIDVSNLHRQVIHAEDRVGISKAESAKMTIEKWV